MGEARRRKSEIEYFKIANDLLANLQGDEKTVAQVSLDVFQKVVLGYDMVEGCYNLAFFLREYLGREHGVKVDIVVGWLVNHNLDGGMSHAWIEYNGKKTDISVWNNERPDIFLPGSVIIQDIEYRKGVTSYSYFKELPSFVRERRDAIKSQDDYHGEFIRKKDAERLMIENFVLKHEGATEYFSIVPPVLSYSFFVSILKQ